MRVSYACLGWVEEGVASEGEGAPPCRAVILYECSDLLWIHCALRFQGRERGGVEAIIMYPCKAWLGLVLGRVANCSAMAFLRKVFLPEQVTASLSAYFAGMINRFIY